jgi:hypothetical protein
MVVVVVVVVATISSSSVEASGAITDNYDTQIIAVPLLLLADFEELRY